MNCFVCKKKVGLLGFDCKCDKDKKFCSSHRYAEQHNCTFDYRAANKEILMKNNPIIVSEKITKI
jgi:hypothetical protein